MTDPPDDKAPGLSRIHRRLIEPIERDGELVRIPMKSPGQSEIMSPGITR